MLKTAGFCANLVEQCSEGLLPEPCEQVAGSLPVAHFHRCWPVTNAPVTVSTATSLGCQNLPGEATQLLEVTCVGYLTLGYTHGLWLQISRAMLPITIVKEPCRSSAQGTQTWPHNVYGIISPGFEVSSLRSAKAKRLASE